MSKVSGRLILWFLDGGFKRDSSVYYDSWEEDNSIVYCITTNTATVGKLLAPFMPTKANYMLLKVQLSAPDAAYNALKTSAPQGMPPTAAPDDFKSALEDKNFMTAEPWAGFKGSETRKFLRTNESNILIEKREYNAMRVYTIVWAPRGDRCRLEGMDRFIWRVIGGELNVDSWTNFMRLTVSVTVGGPN
ncbi:hypothetical protein FGADI_386 [Fusarium gaditjirri]|uniref:Uncharacterized protein n=1 Tax=Fusarium gaditjirri TaxID=282569 RepID=A0A8H4TNB5_9HYPO|nr:hypothetical protein FGADI_386 [Fusarium gaditjirri]